MQVKKEKVNRNKKQVLQKKNAIKNYEKNSTELLKSNSKPCLQLCKMENDMLTKTKENINLIFLHTEELRLNQLKDKTLTSVRY